MARAAYPAHLPPEPHVLVVEDEVLVLLDLVESLKTAGMAVIEGCAGEEAITALQSGVMVDVLITDIRLAGAMNGWDLAEAYRDIDPEGGVIYTSSDALLPARQVANSHFIAKPVNMRALIETCHRLCSDRRSRNAH
jgi:DNA-binding NtrC family response regulator